LQYIIQLSLILLQKPSAHASSQQCRRLKHTTRILIVQREQLTGSLTDLGQRKLHTPNLGLASQTVLPAELQLLVQALLLEGTTGSVSCLAVYFILWWEGGRACGWEGEREGRGGRRGRRGGRREARGRSTYNSGGKQWKAW